jgi:hypothetical protein
MWRITDPVMAGKLPSGLQSSSVIPTEVDPSAAKLNPLIPAKAQSGNKQIELLNTNLFPSRKEFCTTLAF